MKRARGFFIAATALLVLAAFFRFALAGYVVSAVCCVFAAVMCAFFGLMRLWNTKAARVLSGLALTGLGVLAVLFFIAEAPVVADMSPDEDTSADYAIVFGAGVNGTAPSVSMLDRFRAAHAWLDAHPDGTVIVSGCRGGGEDISEAQAMYDWLTSHGAAPERVLMEEQARSSYENLTYSLAMIKERGGDPSGRVALISSEYHMHRLCVIARRLGCDPVRVPGRTSILPLAVNYAVREAFAMWRIWVLGPG